MKKRTKARPKPRPKARSTPRPKKTSSTALARRADVRTIEVADPDGLLAPVAQQLGELAHTAGIGLRPLRLTKAENKIVSRAVDRDRVLVHPKGFIYLPHPVYTRWLDEAFGRGGWSVVPSGRPQKVENLIIVPHILYIRGVPVAFAYGGAEYIEKNKQQTYDDVLESTTAYALRRLCKRFGMALELWEKSYVRAFLAERAIQVEVKDKGRQWRLKNDEPLIDEITRSRRTTAPREPEAGNDGNGNEKIAAEQVRRMVGIWRRVGRADADVQLWLKNRFGVTATRDIKRKDYTNICQLLEARGELALPGDGE